MTDSNMSAYFISGFFFQNQQRLGIDIGPYGSMAVIKGGLYHFPFFGVIHQDEQGAPDDLVGAMSDQFGESQLLDIVISVGKKPEKIKFSKQYADRNYVINYDFTKEDEIWVGNYSGPDGSGVGKGGANCIITKSTLKTFKSLLQPPEEFMAKP